jgi:hypothetical protein
MNQLNKYLIKDLLNIVNFYLSLRTIDFKDDNILNDMSYKDITKVYFKFFNNIGYHVYIGLANNKKYFGFNYIRGMFKGQHKSNIYFSVHLNLIIENLLNIDEINKFYEFQNKQIKLVSN